MMSAAEIARIHAVGPQMVRISVLPRQWVIHRFHRFYRWIKTEALRVNRQSQTTENLCHLCNLWIETAWKFWLIPDPRGGDEDGMSSSTGSNRSMGLVVWLTGLSASGKSTLANALAAVLRAEGQIVVLLDGDVLRAGLCRDLGFSELDRIENVRRAGAVAALLAESGLICIAALISPFASSRDAARKQVPAGRFLEVFVDAPLEVCEQRDPKGLYARARRGEVPTFTGLSSPYEPPVAAECVVRTGEISVAEATARILEEIWRLRGGSV